MVGPDTKNALEAASPGPSAPPAPAPPATVPPAPASPPPTGPSDPVPQPGPQAPPHATAGPVVWPTPGITHTSGWHDCGIIVPQFAASYFYGPMMNQEPDGSYTVRAEVETDLANAGCGVSATYTLQTEVCKKHILFTSCHWADVATLNYTDLPINGKRVSDQLVAPLRNGSNSYRIEADVKHLKHLDAENDPAPGIIGISSDDIDQLSGTVVEQSP